MKFKLYTGDFIFFYDMEYFLVLWREGNSRGSLFKVFKVVVQGFGFEIEKFGVDLLFSEIY